MIENRTLVRGAVDACPQSCPEIIHLSTGFDRLNNGANQRLGWFSTAITVFERQPRPIRQGAFPLILSPLRMILLGFILRERASSFASGFHGSLVNVATSITFVLPETRPKLSHWSACNWCFFKTPYANTSLASSSASVMQTNESPWSFPGPNERPKLCLFPSAAVSLVVDSIKVLSWSAAPGDNPRSMNTASVNPWNPAVFQTV